jgi:nucleoside-diphosphate-sugar epimerase
MRIAVTGATGNVGTSLLAALGREDQVESVLGIARRTPERTYPKTEFAAADVTSDDLVPHLRGADAVVHLAWAIQPSRDRDALWRTNVHGSGRVFEAAAAAGVPALVYASSVGAYSRGPKHRRVDESWPTNGIPSSFYSSHKAQVERRLDRFEAEHPDLRVVRLRPGLIFKYGAASGIRRLFAGPFLPSPLVHPRLIPFVPDTPRLRVQAVHSLDVGDAYRLACVRNVRGAFNVAADPVLGPEELSRVLDARRVRMSEGALRAAAATTWRLRLQPTPPGWIDLALGVPLMDTTRARTELAWFPSRGADEALQDLLLGLRERAGEETPPLAPGTGGPGRVRELLTGIGARDDAER